MSCSLPYPAIIVSKNKMIHDIQDTIREFLEVSLAELKLAPGGPVMLEIPDDARFGDISSNVAMRLSRDLKTNPREIASAILETFRGHLQGAPAKDSFDQIKIEGAGFINFYLSRTYLRGGLLELTAGGKEAFRFNRGRGRRVMVEFVSANPTGPLSVAHARQAVVGDSLANILEFTGFNVSREYYLNDEGNQINILGKSVVLRMKELRGEAVEFPDNHYQGDYIYDIAREYEKFLAASCDHAAADSGEFAASFILNIIRRELDDFGVHFDTWYSQKELRLSGKIEDAFRALREKGFLYEQDGALWFKSTVFGDDKDRVVVKSDGSCTYLAPDIAYHREKFNRGFQWLINLWGPDHHGYISRLKASIQAFGRPAEALSIVIVQLASIYRGGRLIEMSTRRGQYITLREVLDEVGRDASRFFFCMRRTSSHLDFDLETAKKQTPENPVYYVQYAHARICSILRGSTVSPASAAEGDVALLTAPEELALIRKTLRLPYTLDACLQTQDPYLVTVYLQELAESFHKFYDVHRVLGQDESLTRARLALIEGARIALACGLELLGVSCPEKM